MAESFTLHPRLRDDCHVLGKHENAMILLHRNGSLHWFIVVPATEVLDLTDLPSQQRNQLMDTAAALAGVLKRSRGYPRVNIGALGLVVPQLHLHVVGRRESDPCWPAPIWGNLADGPDYSLTELQTLNNELMRALPGFQADDQA